MVMPPSEAAGLCAGDDIVCVGSAGAALAGVLTDAGRRADARMLDLQPDARMLAVLAPALEVRKPLLPLYLRAPDAKPQIGKSLPRA